ncbi:MAG: hypothetical protein JWM78_1851 [Verrucomicrobiaceae bacterium]|nr:hypothetical protein [Verrucomicrobiaceae bacterium]
MVGNIGPMGGLTATPRAGLINDIHIDLMDGKKHVPISDEKLPPDVKNFISMIKPVFSNMLGQFGNGIEIFVFDGADIKNRLNPASRTDRTLHAHFANDSTLRHGNGAPRANMFTDAQLITSTCGGRAQPACYTVRNRLSISPLICAKSV